MSATESPETVVVVNPNSGDGQHAEAIRNRASIRGYGLRETENEGEAVEFSREAAAAGASTVVAAGGDGTINEVLRGIDAADAFDDVTFGVIPVGTGNNFASNIDVTGIDDAFDVIENGERRRIDLGRTDDHLFVNSCVAGLTAESSGDTSDEMKERLGVLAYVVATLRSVAEFESLPISVDIYENGREATVWEGNAMTVLVGNARRFVPGEDSQANVEDGRFDVTVVEDVSALDLMGDAVAGRLFGRASEYVTRFHAPALDITLQTPEATQFSLDGEMVEGQSLSVHTDPGRVEVAVGEGYDPDPDRQ
ncbi:diacylglycerol kinase [Halobacterium sp. DL1]|jgi:YegS/Rv2252/BmrU family lipid kinase|nr:diacylglycerol kinase [Halobacterium sp. DL1]